ncbi:hypothetical protein [Alloalcanivorax xenomutans]|uniref:hypothetical protein n=1 Tax=Alloalcanivorax xenomutans TaxID=1094342 RepID=UPI0006D81D8E|nr:hypothetical protein [Alloalcanivorax xenomutans]
MITLRAKEHWDFTTVKNVVSVEHSRGGKVLSEQSQENAITSAYPMIMLGLSAITQESPTTGTARIYATDNTTPVSKLTLTPGDFNYVNYVDALWQSGDVIRSLVNIGGIDYLEFDVTMEFFNSISVPFTVRSILNRYGTSGAPDFGYFFCGAVLGTPVDVEPGDTLRINYKMRAPCAPTREETIDVPVGSGQLTIRDIDIDGVETPGAIIDWSCVRSYTDRNSSSWPPNSLMGPMYLNSPNFSFEVDGGIVGAGQVTVDSVVSDLTVDAPEYSRTYTTGGTLLRSGTSGTRSVTSVYPAYRISSSRRRLAISFTPAIEVPYTHFLRFNLEYVITWSV